MGELLGSEARGWVEVIGCYAACDHETLWGGYMLDAHNELLRKAICADGHVDDGRGTSMTFRQPEKTPCEFPRQDICKPMDINVPLLISNTRFKRQARHNRLACLILTIKVTTYIPKRPAGAPQSALQNISLRTEGMRFPPQMVILWVSKDEK